MARGLKAGHETVRLRQWRDSDLGGYAEMNADPEVMRHFPRPLTFSESKRFLERSRALIEERGWGFWAVDVEGAFAGFVGLARPSFTAHFTPAVEIAWRLRREYWGRGIAFRASRMAEDYAFSALKLPQLVSFTAVGNLKSRSLMERLGFQRKEDEDFMHPRVPLDSPILRHVLYRKRNPHFPA